MFNKFVEHNNVNKSVVNRFVDNDSVEQMHGLPGPSGSDGDIFGGWLLA